MWKTGSDQHVIDAVRVRWAERSLGGLAGIDPPVGFVFSSARRRRQ